MEAVRSSHGITGLQLSLTPSSSTPIMEITASVIQLQPSSSSHLRPSFSTPHSSPFHFLSLPISISSSPACRPTSFLTRASEPSERIETPNSADLSSASTPPTKKPGGSGSGFGSTVEAKKMKGKVGEKSGVIRRSPSVLPPPGGEGNSSEVQRGAGEGVFVLLWVGLGILILIEGIALAVSGFLPEQWDNVLAKYLYPLFTPTCAVFVCGTTIYGVLKFLQSEKMKS